MRTSRFTTARPKRRRTARQIVMRGRRPHKIRIIPGEKSEDDLLNAAGAADAANVALGTFHTRQYRDGWPGLAGEGLPIHRVVPPANVDARRSLRNYYRRGDVLIAAKAAAPPAVRIDRNVLTSDGRRFLLERGGRQSEIHIIKGNTPEEDLLNIPAIAAEFELLTATIYLRQRRYGWPGINREKLVPHPRGVTDSLRHKHEIPFFRRRDVKAAQSRPTDSDTPEQFVDDGTSYLTAAEARRTLRVGHQTFALLCGGRLTCEWKTHPRSGRRVKAFELAAVEDVRKWFASARTNSGAIIELGLSLRKAADLHEISLERLRHAANDGRLKATLAIKPGTVGVKEYRVTAAAIEEFLAPAVPKGDPAGQWPPPGYQSKKHIAALLEKQDRLSQMALRAILQQGHAAGQIAAKPHPRFRGRLCWHIQQSLSYVRGLAPQPESRAGWKRKSAENDTMLKWSEEEKLSTAQSASVQ